VAYQNAHVKVTIFGTCFGGAEEWSTGFRMGQEGDGGGNFGIGAGWLASILPLWQTFFTHAEVGIGGTWQTTGIKAAIILPDGKTDLANVETQSYGAPISGGKPTNIFPPQVSLVAQLAAASPVGLGAKGRMYLPGVSIVLGANGQLAAADTLKIATHLRTFLDGCESAANSPGYVINASKGRPGVPFTAPVNRRVTQVRVGSVYDTQRRRRNGLTESYSVAAMAA
jgi:hypothetical protein